jgi:hypothetical protein
MNIMTASKLLLAFSLATPLAITGCFISGDDDDDDGVVVPSACVTDCDDAHTECTTACSDDACITQCNTTRDTCKTDCD